VNRPLTDHETAALRAFAREHGPQWKYALTTLWMRAAAQPTLHCLRNSHGPAWLEAFAMEQPARIVSGGSVVVERGCKALGWRKGMRLFVTRADAIVVLQTEELPARTVAFAEDHDLTAMVTTLRCAEGTVEVRALGCEAPREGR
jgi:hypothetical protein